MGFKPFNEVVHHIFQTNTHRLTPSARTLLLVIAGKCTEEGIWFHSYADLTRLAQIGDIKTTMDKVKEIEALDNPKVMSHEQRQLGGKNFYKIYPLCPSDCQEDSHRGYLGANYPLPSGEITPPQGSESPLGIGSKSPSYIETNKPLKEMREGTSLCKNCEATQHEAGIIHQDTCATYKRLIGSIPWEITKNQNSATWLQMTETDKQLAHLASLTAKAKRDSDKAHNQQLQDSSYERAFFQSLKAKPDSNDLTQVWIAWLKELHSQEYFKEIGHFVYLKALYYSRQGLPLPSVEELLQRPRTNPYPDIVAPGCEHEPDQLSA
jgi:hypothetical protein